jgi:prepilin-type N-terminal cleavage/methylation domain-containing protein
MRRHAAFTLLEVMIAVSISAIGIVSLLELFAGSVRLAGVSAKQTEALVLARALVDQQLWKADLEDVDEQGSEGDYQWRVVVAPTDPQFVLGENGEPENPSDDYELKRIDVVVGWTTPRGEQNVHLSTARLTELF